MPSIAPLLSWPNLSTDILDVRFKGRWLDFQGYGYWFSWALVKEMLIFLIFLWRTSWNSTLEEVKLLLSTCLLYHRRAQHTFVVKRCRSFSFLLNCVTLVSQGDTSLVDVLYNCFCVEIFQMKFKCNFERHQIFFKFINSDIGKVSLYGFSQLISDVCGHRLISIGSKRLHFLAIMSLNWPGVKIKQSEWFFLWLYETAAVIELETNQWLMRESQRAALNVSLLGFDPP